MATLIAAIISVLGTLGGVFLGGYIQGRSRKDEWLRQDNTRWLESRRSQYSQLIHTMNRSLTVLSSVDEGEVNECNSLLLHQWAELRILAGSDDVARIAGEFVDLFSGLLRCVSEIKLMRQKVQANPKCNNDEMRADLINGAAAILEGTAALAHLSNAFLSATRLELGLPELEQSPARHSVGAVKKFADRQEENEWSQLAHRLADIAKGKIQDTK
jgi:hypothetical protein